MRALCERGVSRYIARRLMDSLVASPTLVGSEATDLRLDVYRREVALCATWIKWHASGLGPPLRQESDASIREMIAADVSTTNVKQLDQFLLAKGSDKEYPETYPLAVGHRIAFEAHLRCKAYTVTVLHSGCIDHSLVLVKILTNMARRCTAWKRSKDRYLFQQVRTKLNAAHAALLIHLETPMAAISRQLDKRDTNRSVGRLIHDSIASRCEREKWTTSLSIETFVICVSVLQEIMDAEIPLLINHEIPYHSTIYKSMPCFIIESGNYSDCGNRFGYVYNRQFYFVKADDPYPIPETILGWIRTSIDVRGDPSSLEALALAIEHPDTIVESHKMSQFLT